MALGLFSRISNFIICLFHQIGCCFRPKKNRLQEFRKQYKILDKIGGGGFGIVYQVR
ncbi:unnamed protein product [Meloidogyne enterolobii]|uniref:Uncharacterized protein n=2 Tax=Meloidogyne enterolobii TaxID=390850 RepID=A0A6V7VWM2_MELEN|nr:unnamed protein product [Meloidogyne enterolobii]